MSGPELRYSWQGRVLDRSEGAMRMIVESVLAHSWDDAMPFLLAACNTWIGLPFLCTAGKIGKDGKIFADVVTKSDTKERWVFGTPAELERHCRKLADKIKLSDRDRIAFFDAINRWIVCDFRIDPTMDPLDPDAKRLTVH